MLEARIARTDEGNPGVQYRHDLPDHFAAADERGLVVGVEHR
jgi:hypothetical protein